MILNLRATLGLPPAPVGEFDLFAEVHRGMLEREAAALEREFLEMSGDFPAVPDGAGVVISASSAEVAAMLDLADYKPGWDDARREMGAKLS